MHKVYGVGMENTTSHIDTLIAIDDAAEAGDYAEALRLAESMGDDIDPVIVFDLRSLARGCRTTAQLIADCGPTHANEDAVIARAQRG